MDSESEAQEVYRVSDLVADFLQFAHVHYRKDGQSTYEAENITYMVRPLLEALGDLPVDSFRPQDLVTYRAGLFDAPTQARSRFGFEAVCRLLHLRGRASNANDRDRKLAAER